MMRDEFIAWLKDFVQVAGGPAEIAIIRNRMEKLDPPTPPISHPFCGGNWNTGSFDYLWFPNSMEKSSEEEEHDDSK